jgi:hypothetical protein
MYITGIMILCKFIILVVVGVGSFQHHLVDGAISMVLVKALSKTVTFNLEKDKAA